MLVGIISDTHATLPIAAEAALADCDHIIHAGDICAPDILPALRAYAPVTAVLGNNDYPEYGDDVRRFANVEIGGVRFLVAHYPRDVAPSAHGTRALAPGDPLPDVSVHGHTHVPRIVDGREAGPARLLICPGSCTRPRGGFPATVAKIAIEDGRPQRAWVEELKGGKVLMEWRAAGLQ